MFRLRKPNLTFSTRLYLWTTLLILVTFGAVAAIFVAYNNEREEEAAGHYADFLLSEMIGSINERLLTVEDILKGYEPFVKKTLESPDSIMALVREWSLSDSLLIGGSLGFEPYYYAEKGKYFMPYVTTTLGNKPVSKILGSDRYDYFNMEWYTSARKARRGTWSEPYYDDGGGDVMMITYSLPVFDSYGNLVGVMTADMSLDKLVKDVAFLSPYQDSFTFVLSRRGTFISHPQRSMILNHTIFSYADTLQSEQMRQLGRDMLDGISDYDRRTVNGKDMLVNYATIPRTGWSVATFSPYSEVMSHIGTEVSYMVMIMAVGLIGLLVALRYVIRRNTRPLEDLTKVAYKIARGDFSARLPRDTTDAGIRTLVDAFAHMQQSLADYVSSLKQSTIAQARIQSELDIAHAIQKVTIPRTFPTSAGGEGIDVFAVLNPVNTIGGDFYDFTLVDGKFCFCIGTVSCTGTVSTSLLLIVVRSVFRLSVSTDKDPEVTIKAMSDVLRDNPQTDMRTTVFVGSLDLVTGELVYANASHNAPLLVQPDGMTEFLPGSSTLPLGADVFEECSQARLVLKPGSRMVFFTDGIITATNAGGAAYTDYTLYHKVTIIMANYPDLSASELIKRINRTVAEHVGDEPQQRDQALLTFTYKGLPADEKPS